MDEKELEIILLCPTGQDAPLLASALKKQNISSRIVFSIEEFCHISSGHAGGLIVAEEALTLENLDILSDYIAHQETWSDLPIILLTKTGSQDQFKQKRLESFVSSGNVTLLERPIRPITVISAAKVAIRSRQRQYQVKELLIEQLNATRMRDEFISVASHELKTPLTSLKLQTQMAIKTMVEKNEIEHDKINKQLLHTIKQVDRLNKLVDDMLDISRINSGKLQLNREQVNFSDLVFELIERFKPQFQTAKNKIEADIEKNIFGFWDVFKIEQVINNIFSNAIRYSPDAIIKIKLTKSDRLAILSVADQGPGIDEKNLERIFERFERVASNKGIGGLGLGLYITKEILQLHQGHIKVESTLGVGSTFTIELPLAKD